MMRSHSSYIFLFNLLELKVVRLVALGFGCGVLERIGRCCIVLWVLSISCSVFPVLWFPVGACCRAGVWVNLAVLRLVSTTWGWPKFRPKHVVVFYTLYKMQFNKLFVVFRLTVVAYCIAVRTQRWCHTLTLNSSQKTILWVLISDGELVVGRKNFQNRYLLTQTFEIKNYVI